MRFLLISVFFLVITDLRSQYTNLQINKDSLQTKSNDSANSILHSSHKPSVATKRSAILPGWGQAYNKEYWKIPIVYAAIAIPAYTFFYNNSYYQKTKFAYQAKLKIQNNNDSSDYNGIDPQLKNLNLYSLQLYRNNFRRDRDYSIVWFLLLWGLNVADATVFAHLKNFDVSDNLSMQIKPQLDPTLHSNGFSLTFHTQENRNIKKKKII